MTAETAPDRYATVLDALAHSPVREQAEPQGVPERPGDELSATVRKLASRVPQVARRFGISPATGSDGDAHGGRPADAAIPRATSGAGILAFRVP
ncbi:MAG: hypothetical protein U5R31_04430 [Acidimicrobiia bacterium]|nr:hypothetical protein [Acidimicrobiia bacterium]